MRIDFSRYVPLGLNGKKEAQWLAAGIGCAALIAVIRFLGQYFHALDHLYRIVPEVGRQLIPWAVMTDFSELIVGCELGFLLICLAMVALSAYHYYYHTLGSKPIYLMRRLPRHWELHRRCLTLPAAGVVSSMAVLGALSALFYLIYRFCTPAQCLR